MIFSNITCSSINVYHLLAHRDYMRESKDRFKPLAPLPLNDRMTRRKKGLHRSQILNYRSIVSQPKAGSLSVTFEGLVEVTQLVP